MIAALVHCGAPGGKHTDTLLVDAGRGRLPERELSQVPADELAAVESEGLREAVARERNAPFGVDNEDVVRRALQDDFEYASSSINGGYRWHWSA